MYEDIEILRRILDQSVPQAYDPHPLATWNYLLKSPDNSNHVPNITVLDATNGVLTDTEKMKSNDAIWLNYDLDGKLDLNVANRNPRIEGVAAGHGEGFYLEGYGAVITLDLPFNPDQLLADNVKPAPKPLSPWDRVRKEIRGEKSQPTNPSKEPPKTTVADILLRVLAENGHHFSLLAEDESITVAMTFRGARLTQQAAGACMSCHVQVDPHAMVCPNPQGRAVLQDANDLRAWSKYLTRTVRDGSADALNQPVPTEKPGTPVLRDPFNASVVDSNNNAARKLLAETANFKNLGDMRLKDQRLKEAAEAYRQAVDGYQRILESKNIATQSEDQKKDQKQLFSAATEAYSKLAQAYLAQGENDKAAQTLKDLTGKIQQPLSAAANTAANKPAPVVLPSKLIISAPKPLLDQVGSGRISFDAFKQGVRIQSLNFSPKNQEPAKNSN
jgi:hypothetical protein